MATYSIDLCVKSLARKTKIELVIPSLNLQGCLKIMMITIIKIVKRNIH